MALRNPRLRSLLRQADKTAAAGKRAAARQLYEEVLEEAPETVEALLGLATVTRDEDKQRRLYEQVLAIVPDHEAAKAALEGNHEGIKTTVVPGALFEKPRAKAPPPPVHFEEKVEPQPRMSDVILPSLPVVERDTETEELVCYRHPARPTGLRCYTCERPICIKCAVHTPVGYRCPQCIKDAQDVFFTATHLDYGFAGSVSMLLGGLAGILLPAIGFFVIFLAPVAGTLIGRLAFRAARRRHGRWLAHLVAGMVVLGAALPLLLPLAYGQMPGLFSLLWRGVYAFMATGAAYYQVR